MSTSTFQAQEKFKADRLHWIGGSDVPNLFNLEPYYCERRLGYFKTDALADVAFWGNKATERGTRLEQMAAEVYAEVTGRELRKSVPRVDDVVDCLRPQPDRDILNSPRGPAWGPGLLSIKVSAKENWLRLKAAIESMLREPTSDWQKKQAEDGRKMLRPYILQLQAELGSRNLKWGSFAFFCADLWDICYVDIDADPEIIDEIRARARVFWDIKETKGVEGFERLDPKSRQCGKCEFRVTCQSAHLLALLEGENRDLDKRDFPVIPQLDMLIDRLRERQQLENEAGVLVDEAKGEIRSVLSDCDAAEGIRTRAYNKLLKGRETLQKDPLLKFAADFAERAQSLVNKASDTPEWDLAAQMLLSEAAKLDELIAKKFTKRGAPYRELRCYDLAKKSTAQ